MSHRLFYEHIGELVSAMLKVDGTVDPVEAGRSRSVIGEFVGSHAEFTRENNSAEALIALIAFDRALASQSTPLDLFDSFEQYAAGNNGTRVGKDLLDDAYLLLVKAAASYKGVNKVEQDLLNRIEAVFERTWQWKKQA